MSQQSEVSTASTQVVEANTFNITGSIVISYSRTSVTGVPVFSYNDGELNLNFSGSDDIAQKDTPLGEIVTITLQNIPDAFIRTFTLLVPKTRLRIGDQPSFDTQGIETIDRSIGRPCATPRSNRGAANLSVAPAPGRRGVQRLLIRNQLN